MNISESVYLHYLSALLDGNKTTCIDIIDELLKERAEVRIVYEQIIRKSMCRTGELWDKCRISIADEHVASEITRDVISYIGLNTNRNEPGLRTAVVTCVNKEKHDLGAKIISNFFELKGWGGLNHVVFFVHVMK